MVISAAVDHGPAKVGVLSFGSIPAIADLKSVTLQCLLFFATIVFANAGVPSCTDVSSAAVFPFIVGVVAVVFQLAFLWLLDSLLWLEPLLWLI
jgi:hypothetical protein